MNAAVNIFPLGAAVGRACFFRVLSTTSMMVPIPDAPKNPSPEPRGHHPERTFFRSNRPHASFETIDKRNVYTFRETPTSVYSDHDLPSLTSSTDILFF